VLNVTPETHHFTSTINHLDYLFVRQMFNVSSYLFDITSAS